MADKFELLIDGKLVAAAETFSVINPATGQVLAEAPHASKEQVMALFSVLFVCFFSTPLPPFPLFSLLPQAEQAVAAAKSAYPKWAALSGAERAVCFSSSFPSPSVAELL